MDPSLFQDQLVDLEPTRWMFWLTEYRGTPQKDGRASDVPVILPTLCAFASQFRPTQPHIRQLETYIAQTQLKHPFDGLMWMWTMRWCLSDTRDVARDVSVDEYKRVHIISNRNPEEEEATYAFLEALLRLTLGNEPSPVPHVSRSPTKDRAWAVLWYHAVCDDLFHRKYKAELTRALRLVARYLQSTVFGPFLQDMCPSLFSSDLPKDIDAVQKRDVKKEKHWVQFHQLRVRDDVYGNRKEQMSKEAYSFLKEQPTEPPCQPHDRCTTVDQHVGLYCLWLRACRMDDPLHQFPDVQRQHPFVALVYLLRWNRPQELVRWWTSIADTTPEIWTILQHARPGERAVDIYIADGEAGKDKAEKGTEKGKEHTRLFVRTLHLSLLRHCLPRWLSASVLPLFEGAVQPVVEYQGWKHAMTLFHEHSRSVYVVIRSVPGVLPWLWKASRLPFLSPWTTFFLRSMLWMGQIQTDGEADLTPLSLTTCLDQIRTLPFDDLHPTMWSQWLGGHLFTVWMSGGIQNDVDGDGDGTGCLTPPSADLEVERPLPRLQSFVQAWWKQGEPTGKNAIRGHMLLLHEVMVPRWAPVVPQVQHDHLRKAYTMWEHLWKSYVSDVDLPVPQRTFPNVLPGVHMQPGPDRWLSKLLFSFNRSLTSLLVLCDLVALDPKYITSLARGRLCWPLYSFLSNEKKPFPEPRSAKVFLSLVSMLTLVDQDTFEGIWHLFRSGVFVDDQEPPQRMCLLRLTQWMSHLLMWPQEHAHADADPNADLTAWEECVEEQMRLALKAYTYDDGYGGSTCPSLPPFLCVPEWPKATFRRLFNWYYDYARFPSSSARMHFLLQGLEHFVRQYEHPPIEECVLRLGCIAPHVLDADVYLLDASTRIRNMESDPSVPPTLQQLYLFSESQYVAAFVQHPDRFAYATDPALTFPALRPLLAVQTSSSSPLELFELLAIARIPLSHALNEVPELIHCMNHTRPVEETSTNGNGIQRAITPHPHFGHRTRQVQQEWEVCKYLLGTVMQQRSLTDVVMRWRQIDINLSNMERSFQWALEEKRQRTAKRRRLDVEHVDSSLSLPFPFPFPFPLPVPTPEEFEAGFQWGTLLQFVAFLFATSLPSRPLFFPKDVRMLIWYHMTHPST